MVAALNRSRVAGRRDRRFVGASLRASVAVSDMFSGGTSRATAESIQAANAILKSLNSLNAASLVIFMISGGGSVDR